MNKTILEEKLDIKLNKNQELQFSNFEQLFKIYNSHTNLISKKDEENLFEKHIFDSLCLSLFLQKYNIKNAKVFDIGTGGGFPAIPLSIIYPEFEIYPIDSIAKKIGFIELVQKELRLNNIYPICKRVEDLPETNKETYDIVTSRAVASLNILLEYAMPFVKVDGYFVAYKAKTANVEIEQAQNALKVLNAKIIDRIEYKLPLEENFVRELLIIKKESSTPKKYPRKAGMIKKNPL